MSWRFVGHCEPQNESKLIVCGFRSCHGLQLLKKSRWPKPTKLEKRRKAGGRKKWVYHVIPLNCRYSHHLTHRLQTMNLFSGKSCTVVERGRNFVMWTDTLIFTSGFSVGSYALLHTVYSFQRWWCLYFRDAGFWRVSGVICATLGESI